MTYFARTLLIGVAVSSIATVAAAQEGSNLERAFAQADLNHDGVVTRAEFQSSREARFRTLDRNRDGYLSADDLPKGLGLFRPNAARVTQMLALFDTDHDGRISLAEFVAGSMRLFDQTDVNHDGVLTRAEANAAAARLKAALAPNR